VGAEAEVVRVRLLGGFWVAVGSRTIEEDAWRLRKASALVKLLALAPGRRLHREQLMNLLWPELGKKAASNNLRHTFHTARTILNPTEGSRYLASEEESLALCSRGDVWVDVDAFEEAAVSARRSRDPAVYRAALDLYGGELLPEDRYEEWTEGRREELRQLYLALLIELADLYEERHEHGLAIDALREATAKEPTFEEAHASLMRLHALSGRPEQALAQYERLRDTLYRGLGTEPGATTRRLRDEIAAGTLAPTLPAGSASQQEEESPSAHKHNLPAPRTNFIGREHGTGSVTITPSLGPVTTNPVIQRTNPTFFVSPTTPITISPGGAGADLLVSFLPTWTVETGPKTITYTGSLNLKDAGGNTVLTVPLKGVATPCIVG
jgi:DNA-binding SARP family transcriptional activator